MSGITREQIQEVADRYGIEVEFDSDNPGVFVDGKRMSCNEAMGETFYDVLSRTISQEDDEHVDEKYRQELEDLCKIAEVLTNIHNSLGNGNSYYDALTEIGDRIIEVVNSIYAYGEDE